MATKETMLANMAPVLTADEVVFCTTTDPELTELARPCALGWFQEDEGLSMILSVREAERLGFDASLSMRRIVLQVFSALDGVGLTATVSAALADAGIPCNMVAAFHHDHVFVPTPTAERAISVLTALPDGAFKIVTRGQKEEGFNLTA